MHEQKSLFLDQYAQLMMVCSPDIPDKCALVCAAAALDTGLSWTPSGSLPRATVQHTQRRLLRQARGSCLARTAMACMQTGPMATA